MTVTEVVDTAVADDRGVSLPTGTEGVLTVSLDGRYVWAFSPGRDGEASACALPCVRNPS